MPRNRLDSFIWNLVYVSFQSLTANTMSKRSRIKINKEIIFFKKRKKRERKHWMKILHCKLARHAIFYHIHYKWWIKEIAENASHQMRYFNFGFGAVQCMHCIILLAVLNQRILETSVYSFFMPISLFLSFGIEKSFTYNIWERLHNSSK